MEDERKINRKFFLPWKKLINYKEIVVFHGRKYFS